MTQKPILLTGSHRSGSTWAGKMLALSKDTGYIWEPFNLIHRPGICSAKFEYWFQYVNNENGYLYENDIRDCIDFKYKVFEEVKALSSTKDVGRMFRDFSLSALYRLENRRALLKDPIALLSTEWLAETFNMDIVILIRHPAAFAGSLKKANWEFPFSHMAAQPLLMDKLPDYRAKIEDYAEHKKDIIDQACLLWNILHARIHDFMGSHPDWIFIKHEDLSRNPIKKFEEIYRKLGLSFDASVEKTIIEYTSDKNPKEQQTLASVHRDSVQNIDNWKKRLSPEEILKIRKSTEAVSDLFYSDFDW